MPRYFVRGYIIITSDMAGNVGFKNVEDEVMVTIALIILSLFAYLSVSPEAGIVLFMMVMTYFVSLGSKNLREIEVLRNDKKSRDVLKIGGIILAATSIWIVVNSVIYGASRGEFSIYSPDMFKAVYLHSNIPILATDPVMIQTIWGFVFPIIESFFFLSVVLLFFNRIIFGRWKVPEKIDSRNIGKVFWVAMLVGATASLIHFQTRQAESWALLGDFVFFSLSSVVVYKTKQLLEAAGVHGIINNLVLLLGGA